MSTIYIQYITYLVLLFSPIPKRTMTSSQVTTIFATLSSGNYCQRYPSFMSFAWYVCGMMETVLISMLCGWTVSSRISLHYSNTKLCHDTCSILFKICYHRLGCEETLSLRTEVDCLNIWTFPERHFLPFWWISLFKSTVRSSFASICESCWSQND